MLKMPLKQDLVIATDEVDYLLAGSKDQVSILVIFTAGHAVLLMPGAIHMKGSVCQW